MIINETYGPQFDAADGTIGNLKLVKRYAIVRSNGFIFGGNQGKNTCSTQEEADILLSKYDKLENAWLGKLKVRAFWCYPEHFDPVGLAESNGEISK